MSTKPAYVVSDIHLGAVPAATERAFRAFLRHVAAEAASLLINGDLFDFWFEYRHVILAEHYRVLAALTDVVEAGVPVTFVGGNHDGWGGAFLRDRVGMQVVDGPLTMELAGRLTLVAHGDGVGEGDLRYRAMKAVIRSRASSGAFRLLHPDLGRRVALLASATERRAHEPEDRGRNRAEFIRRWGEAQLAARPELRLVVAGHAHVPLVHEAAPGRYFANSGDWVRDRRTYLVVPPGSAPPELRDWG